MAEYLFISSGSEFYLLDIDIMVIVLQAEKAAWNSIGIFKLSNISGKRRELVPTPTTKATADDTDMDSDGSDSDEDSENEDGGSGTPNLQVPF